MTRSLDPALLRDAEVALRDANLAFARRYPGERADAAPQPVHTLIEGAQRFTADVTRRLGDDALRALDRFAPDATWLSDALGVDVDDALLTRVRDKLARDPVEDYRVDFEDGYGVRSDDDEDREVARVADEIARGVRDGLLPQSLGARVKPLGEETRGRSVRTLDLLVTALVRREALPRRFVVTLPKVAGVVQVDYFVAALRALERALGLDERALRFEVQIELPQTIVDASGRSTLPRLLDASDGRLVGANLGVYDYTAACGITAAHQGPSHPAAAFARRAMQAAFAGTGVWLSDGSVARLPVGDRASVHAGWRLHHDEVRRALGEGFYQGWDLHAAQLVSRHAAVARFYRESMDAAGARLRALLGRAAESALVGGVLDEPATGQGLLGFFARAISVGAIDENEAIALSGLTRDELREPSFVRILDAREAR